MSSLDSQLTQLQAQMLDLSNAMRAAKRTGQTAALAQFQVQYRELARQLAALRLRANQAGAPSSFMLKLDAFSDTVINAGESLGVAVRDVIGSVGFLARYGIFLLIGGVVLLVVYYGKAYKVALSRAGK